VKATMDTTAPTIILEKGDMTLIDTTEKNILAIPLPVTESGALCKARQVGTMTTRATKVTQALHGEVKRKAGIETITPTLRPPCRDSIVTVGPTATRRCIGAAAWIASTASLPPAATSATKNTTVTGTRAALVGSVVLTPAQHKRGVSGSVEATSRDALGCSALVQTRLRGTLPRSRRDSTASVRRRLQAERLWVPGTELRQALGLKRCRPLKSSQRSLESSLVSVSYHWQHF
jgi:hypothetical protein